MSGLLIAFTVALGSVIGGLIVGSNEGAYALAVFAVVNAIYGGVCYKLSTSALRLYFDLAGKSR